LVFAAAGLNVGMLGHQQATDLAQISPYFRELEMAYLSTVSFPSRC